jgi:hypothetical protein
LQVRWLAPLSGPKPALAPLHSLQSGLVFDSLLPQ